MELELLVQKLRGASIDHADLEVMLLVGRADAFPHEVIVGPWDHVTWPVARRDAKPIATFIDSFPGEGRVTVPKRSKRRVGSGNVEVHLSAESYEVLAFFGEQDDLRRLHQLSAACMQAMPSGVAPRPNAKERNHKLWTRWLIRHCPEHIEYDVVFWHKRNIVRFKKGQQPLFDARSFDPLKPAAIPQEWVDRGVRPYGCRVARFKTSIFAISAEAIRMHAGVPGDARTPIRKAWHGPDERRPAEFQYGPLRGTKTDLASRFLPPSTAKGPRTRQLDKRLLDDLGLWGQHEGTRGPYEIWFREINRYNTAKKRFEQVPAASGQR